MAHYNGVERRRRNLWPLIAFLVLALVAAWANYQAYSVAERADEAVAQIDREGVERRHQICLTDEKVQGDIVVRLNRTYGYVKELQPAEYTDTLNRFIILSLPDLEDDAETDAAPAFCDEPGVGLPEPDPEIPPRPEVVDEALKIIEATNPR
jgi:hypothetical protein